jgi:uncharacterized membrane protein
MGSAAGEPAGAASMIRWWVEQAATGIEILAVAIIVATIGVATIVYLARILTRAADAVTYREYRHRVARALLLGLEILVAADIIRTVALEPTLRNVMVLGLLVLIRTFLSWGLVVEIEGRWPWTAAQGQEVAIRRPGPPSPA